MSAALVVEWRDGRKQSEQARERETERGRDVELRSGGWGLGSWRYPDAETRGKAGLSSHVGL